MSPNKAELRLQAKARRANRGPFEVSSDLIVWINCTISKGATIACYISREDELNTAELIELLKFEYQVVSPVTTSHGLIFKEHSNELVVGKYSILEPTGAEIKISQIDCFIIPALAVDKTGNRLGFGAGYFDQALNQTKKPVVCAVANEDILDLVPTKEHDRQIDFIVTQSQIIKTSNL
jgi:5-formyltetrahydrofolate cyclo-ligase